MSSLEDNSYDEDWDNAEEISEKWSSRSKKRDRQRYLQLKRQAEDRIARRKLKEQLGYYDYDDLEGIEL